MAGPDRRTGIGAVWMVVGGDDRCVLAVRAAFLMIQFESQQPSRL
jgi:hypothetical protein